VLYPHELAAKWGADFPLNHVEPRLKCTACAFLGSSLHFVGKTRGALHPEIGYRYSPASAQRMPLLICGRMKVF
jgi:hypothetical protein